MSRLEVAKVAIEKVFSNTTVSRQQTKEDLEELLDIIQTYLDAL